MSMLERLYVHNYRCLVNFECRPAAKQLILGPNGAGKSTLLNVLELLRDFCVRGERPDRQLVGETRTRWITDTAEQAFEIDVAGDGGKYTFRLVVDSYGSPERPRVLKEELDYCGTPIFRFAEGEVHLYNDRLDGKAYVQYPFDWHRSALATITERRDNKKLSWFKRWLGGLLCVRPNPWRMSDVAQKRDVVEAPAGDLSNFTDWYYQFRLGDERTHSAMLSDLRHAVEGFETMDLKPAGPDNLVLQVTLSSEEDQGGSSRSDSHRFGELSEGQRVLIGLYAVLHFALRPGVTLCFDEPDNFIALREVQPWLSKVLDRVEDEESKSQVLIISHHPELLNRMAFQDGLVLDRPGGRHTRARRFDDPSQTGLSPAELIARGWDRE